MIDFLLKEIEKSPNPIFTKNELTNKSAKEFERLKKSGVLAFRQPSERELQRIRLPRCPHGCSLTVSPIGDQLEAVCLDHPEEGTFAIEQDDLFRYLFSIDSFLTHIRKSNGFEGKLQRIKGGYYYIGYKLYDDKRVGYIFIPKFDSSEFIALSGLKNICRDDDYIVALTPVSEMNDFSLSKAIRNSNIIQKPMLPILNPETFEMRIDDLISKFIKPKAEFTRKQMRDYKEYGYLCKDKIHLLGITPGYHSNLILVNGSEIKIGDSLVLLLLRLVRGLKQKSDGWVSIYTLYNEHIISDSNRHQIYSNLRSAIKGHLIENDGKKFVESDGSKNYRISTHPDFVTYDKRKLKRHQNAQIRKIAAELPKSRRNIGTKLKS